jgi:hypothetical protein
MARFLIEVPHEPTARACARAIELFLKTGSHFLAHADWGCKDGEHKAWIMVELDTKHEARGIVPPPYRTQARVIQLNTFTIEDLEEILRHHAD